MVAAYELASHQRQCASAQPLPFVQMQHPGVQQQMYLPPSSGCMHGQSLADQWASCASMAMPSQASGFGWPAAHALMDPAWLDELQLLRRGIPTGAAVVEAATQTPPTGEQLTTPPRYVGTVTEVVEQRGERLWLVTYDSQPDKPYAHNFANTKRNEAHVDVYNATLFAVLGEDATPFECASAELLDARRASLRNAAGAVVTAECLKATQRLVDVSTPIGKCVYRVPANKKELLNSPEREHWLAADEKGLDCILRGPGNCLVPVTVPAAKGVPVQRCVTARKIKVDQATGRLDKHDPYKSRHSADGGFAKVQRERAGLPASQVPATSTVVDDMTTKLFLGHAAAIDANLTKGDVGNAYIKAKRQGPVGYMSLPSTLPMTDEDGTQLCIELSTPLWGADQAMGVWSWGQGLRRAAADHHRMEGRNLSLEKQRFNKTVQHYRGRVEHLIGQWYLGVFLVLSILGILSFVPNFGNTGYLFVMDEAVDEANKYCAGDVKYLTIDDVLGLDRGQDTCPQACKCDGKPCDFDEISTLWEAEAGFGFALLVLTILTYAVAFTGALQESPALLKPFVYIMPALMGLGLITWNPWPAESDFNRLIVASIAIGWTVYVVSWVFVASQVFEVRVFLAHLAKQTGGPAVTGHPVAVAMVQAA
ncbi:hypothetical protein EMIHUDRAFT_243041 [Emiliania huxleyi CCMP1516]|uniref:Uncharacterized protein n=2 Tax=Emiliania huxleyi TaxID=2903 RepID=A0A0D3J6X9_EMIH1|nr:hypothetical protein EMIHUDRAFT_243041 [Emiliania huxleyi CCMP1516]EOD19264.1 hypothetical protein EMIHUDRAFT_243041 [Emiliania huxleyi CCMP1516]|eukprot:XP_005771693.1 hypothetical protein EMIHUDRAFT_243041 [Emiliania huxleyi CCMP1516]